MGEYEFKAHLDIEGLKEYDNLFTNEERKELVGQMLRLLRARHEGLTQREVAELIGVKPVTYSTYENGTREIPTEMLVRLSILFDTPIDFIVQKERTIRDDYDKEKQLDMYNEMLEELKDVIRAPELNEDAKKLLESMSKAFDAVGEQFAAQNNIKKE